MDLKKVLTDYIEEIRESLDESFEIITSGYYHTGEETFESKYFRDMSYDEFIEEFRKCVDEYVEEIYLREFALCYMKCKLIDLMRNKKD